MDKGRVYWITGLSGGRKNNHWYSVVQTVKGEHG